MTGCGLVFFANLGGYGIGREKREAAAKAASKSKRRRKKKR
jgi:hypothetical protein